MISIKFRHIALVAYLFFLVPIAIFCFGWLKWYYATTAVLLLAAGFIWLYRSDYLANKDCISIPLGHLIAIVALFGFWTAMSGTVGVAVECFDTPWRNAILRDLINYPWPVVYEQTGFALAYYFIFWMVPALIGKLLGWTAALITLWIWETFILTLAFLLIAYLLKAEKPSTFWMIALVFIFWSGLNLLGGSIMQLAGNYEIGLSYNENYCDIFFEGESTNYYYRSNIDCLEESYNQIMLWIAVPLMLQNRKMHSFMFIGLVLVPFSPWATIGIIPLMLALGGVELAGYVKETGWGKALVRTLKEICSPANLVALFACAAVFACFFASAAQMSAATSTNNAASSGSFGFLTFSNFKWYNWMSWGIFCMCEFGIVALLIRSKFNKDPLFWVTVGFLAAAPFIWVGTIYGRDFCMNGSLPALCVLMVYTMTYLKDEVMGKALGLKNLVLVIALTIAFISPVFQIASQVETMFAHKSLYVQSHSTDVTSFEGLPIERCANFVSSHPDETFFFKHLAK